MRVLRLRLAWLCALLGLACCADPPNEVLLDLARAAPFAVQHQEAQKVDLGDLSESQVVWTGFGPPQRGQDGVSFRGIQVPTASVQAWMFRPGSWMLRWRYRWSASATPGELRLGTEKIADLRPSQQWIEAKTLLPADRIQPGQQVLTFTGAPGLQLDWLDFQTANAAEAPEIALPHTLDRLSQAGNSEWVFHARIPEESQAAHLEYGLTAGNGPILVQIEIQGESWTQPVSVEHRLEAGESLQRQAIELAGKGACRIRLRAISERRASLAWKTPLLRIQPKPSAQALALPTPPPLPPPPRDIFLFILDAARADHFGAYGRARWTSPWIDRLARQGIQFAVARSQAPYTQSSTGTLMTSLEPETHDVRAVNSRLSDKADTLAEVLHQAGYATSAFIGCANADRPFGFAQGFDLFTGGRQDKTLEGMEQMLRKHDRNFMYIHLFQPHHPYTPPAPFQGLYSNEFPGAAEGTAEGMLALRRIAAKLPPPELERLKAQYDENLLYGDTRVGEILGLIDRLGREREALILILADHGEAFSEHGSLLHGFTVYDEDIRIPMILRPPQSWNWKPRVTLDPVGSLNILPTLVELARARDSAPLRHGRSLVPELLGNRTATQEVYSRAQGVQLTASLSGPRWKVHILEGSTELYDLMIDPGEKKNLVRERPILAGWLRQKALERHTRNVLDGLNAGLRETTVLDEETERELRALGYIE